MFSSFIVLLTGNRVSVLLTNKRPCNLEIAKGHLPCNSNPTYNNTITVEKEIIFVKQQ